MLFWCFSFQATGRVALRGTDNDLSFSAPVASTPPTTEAGIQTIGDIACWISAVKTSCSGRSVVCFTEDTAPLRRRLRLGRRGQRDCDRRCRGARGSAKCGGGEAARVVGEKTGNVGNIYNINSKGGIEPCWSMALASAVAGVGTARAERASNGRRSRYAARRCHVRRGHVALGPQSPRSGHRRRRQLPHDRHPRFPLDAGYDGYRDFIQGEFFDKMSHFAGYEPRATAPKGDHIFAAIEFVTLGPATADYRRLGSATAAKAPRPDGSSSATELPDDCVHPVRAQETAWWRAHEHLGGRPVRSSRCLKARSAHAAPKQHRAAHGVQCAISPQFRLRHLRALRPGWR